MDPGVDARILERGYRHYEGERRGQGHAIRALARHTFQRVMGLRRTARSKVLPFASVAIAYLPAITFIGVLALIPEETTARNNLIRPISDYYGFVTAAILLLITFAAPEALCPDRRWRSLSLYLASPLDRRTYLLSKAVAVAGALSLVSLGPTLVYFIGRVVQNAGPRGIDNFGIELARIIASGVFLAVFYTSLSMAVASLTDRRGFATGGTLLLVAGSRFVFGALHFGFGVGDGVKLVDLGGGPYEVVQRIFGRPGETPGLATPLCILGFCAIAGACAAFVLARYKRLLVTR